MVTTQTVKAKIAKDGYYSLTPSIDIIRTFGADKYFFADDSNNKLSVDYDSVDHAMLDYHSNDIKWEAA